MTTLKDFIATFDITNPNWDNTPKDFPKCDLTGLSSQDVGKFLGICGLWEITKTSPKKPVQKSRVWQDPKGFEYLGVWQNAALLRVLIRKFTLNLTLKNPFEKRLKAQMDDCARSVKRNIEEGWKRPTTSEYLQFLGYSQASLEELKGDIRDCKTDGFLASIKSSSLEDLRVNIRVQKGPQDTWGEPTDPGHPYCQPLEKLQPNTLTYEIFIELINKTDYLLRKLVESLETKLNEENKGYQIDRLRIKGKIKGY